MKIQQLFHTYNKVNDFMNPFSQCRRLMAVGARHASRGFAFMRFTKQWRCYIFTWRTFEQFFLYSNVISSDIGLFSISFISICNKTTKAVGNQNWFPSLGLGFLSSNRSKIVLIAANMQLESCNILESVKFNSVLY